MLEIEKPIIECIDKCIPELWEVKKTKFFKDLFDEKKIGNICVALSTEELTLFLKKMKWKSFINIGRT